MPTILVADDDVVIRRVLTMLLDDAGYRVVAVESTRAALAVDEPYDLALVDAYLDQRARTDLPDELRRRNPQVRVVVMSGLPVAEHYPFADAVLEKPFSAEELRAALNGALNDR
jgi:CheY-like chemotaxis protein